MVVNCQTCNKRFDDAERDTGCPHDLIAPIEILRQKDAAMKLIGEDIYFNHEPGKFYHVQSINFEGMVSLRELPGEFAPHLFKIRTLNNSLVDRHVTP